MFSPSYFGSAIGLPMPFPFLRTLSKPLLPCNCFVLLTIASPYFLVNELLIGGW